MLGRWIGLGMLVVAMSWVGLAAPTQAQVAGQWAFPFGTTRLYVENRAGVNSLEAPSISTTVTIDVPHARGVISFFGTYRNLVWEGTWYQFDGRPPMGVAFQACARPQAHPGRRETMVYGTFRVTFNAAENRFEGVMSRCRAQPGQAGYSQPLVGTRNNTFTVQGGPAQEPETREVPRLPFNIPITPPIATPEQQAAIQEAELERVCRSLRQNLAVAWSQDFDVHPCVYNIGDQVEVITRRDQTQRPVSLRYRAFHVMGGSRVLYLRTGSRRGFGFQGLPRAGHRYTVTFGGDICSEGLWMLSVIMSDGTETAPIGIVLAGPEQVPLFRRSCAPDPHRHERADFADPDDPDVIAFTTRRDTERLEPLRE